MSLRCKAGDLAIVTTGAGGKQENLGKIVKCLRLAESLEEGLVWEVDQPMVWILDPFGLFKFMQPYAPDRALTPIPPDILADETNQDMGVTA